MPPLLSHYLSSTSLLLPTVPKSPNTRPPSTQLHRFYAPVPRCFRPSLIHPCSFCCCRPLAFASESICLLLPELPPIPSSSNNTHVSSSAPLSVLLSVPFNAHHISLIQEYLPPFDAPCCPVISSASPPATHYLYRPTISSACCLYHPVISPAITRILIFRSGMPLTASTNRHILRPEYLILPSLLLCVSTAAISVFLSLCHQRPCCPTSLPAHL